MTGIWQRKNGKYRRPRHRHRRQRRIIRVPPNDEYNYFFSNENCGKYRFYGYSQHQNYPIEETQ